MNCPKCGAILEENAEFCKSCGSPIFNQTALDLGTISIPTQAEEPKAENSQVEASVVEENSVVSKNTMSIEEVKEETAASNEVPAEQPASAEVSMPVVENTVEVQASPVEVTPVEESNVSIEKPLAPVVSPTPEINPAPVLPTEPVVEEQPLVEVKVEPIRSVETPVVSLENAIPVVEPPITQAPPVVENPPLEVQPPVETPVVSVEEPSPSVSQPVEVTSVVANEPVPSVAESQNVEVPQPVNNPVPEITPQVVETPQVAVPTSVVEPTPVVMPAPVMEQSQPVLAQEPVVEPSVTPVVSSEPVQQEKPKKDKKQKGSNKKALIVIILIVVLVALIGAGVFFITKDKHASGNPPSGNGNKKDQATYYTVRANNVSFKVPTDYIFEVDRTIMYVTDKDHSFEVVLKALESNYDYLNESKDKLNEIYKSYNYGVNAYEEKTLNNRKYLAYEVDSYGEKVIYAYTPLNDMVIFTLEAYSKERTYDYSILEKMASILDNAEYVQEFEHYDIPAASPSSMLIGLYKTDEQ